MFMIHSPQSVELMATPADDSPPVSHGMIAFDHESDDVSKCRMIITSKDKVWTYTFSTRGGLEGSAYEDDAIRAQQKAAAEQAAKNAQALQKKEQEAARAQAAKELKTADDTTAADLSSEPAE